MKTIIKRKIRLLPLAALVSMLLYTCSATVHSDASSADRAKGTLSISMAYNITSNYLNGDPFLCVYLSSDDTNGRYFLRLHYNSSQKVSTARIDSPYVGTYNVSYYTPLPGKDNECEKYLKNNDSRPDYELFREVRPSYKNTTRSIYAGGAMFLDGNAPTIVRIGSTGGSMNFSSRVGFDCMIPAAHVAVQGIENVKEIYPYEFILYATDRSGKIAAKIGQATTVGNTDENSGYTRYFEDIIIPNPGNTYYYVEEKTSAPYMSTDRSVFIKAVTDYVGDRLCVKKLSIVKKGKTRSIDIALKGTDTLTMTITDPDASGAKYYLYGPYETTFINENDADGTFPGKAAEIRKTGANTWTVSSRVIKDVWGCFFIVKKVNGIVDRGCTINIPFHMDSNYLDGKTSMVWRVRPRASFVSTYTDEKPKKTAITGATGGAGQGTITWKKAAAPATGYEIEICTSKYFDKGVFSKKVSKLATTSYTKSLKAGTKYYVRIRTYREFRDMNAKKITVYSDWSAVKSLTTK